MRTEAVAKVQLGSTKSGCAPRKAARVPSMSSTRRALGLQHIVSGGRHRLVRRNTVLPALATATPDVGPLERSSVINRRRRQCRPRRCRHRPSSRGGHAGRRSCCSLLQVAWKHTRRDNHWEQLAFHTYHAPPVSPWLLKLPPPPPLSSTVPTGLPRSDFVASSRPPSSRPPSRAASPGDATSKCRATPKRLPREPAASMVLAA